MTQSSIKSTVYFIVGALLVFLFMKNCTGNSVQKGREIDTKNKTMVVKLITKLDTVYVKKYVNVVKTVEVPTLVKADTVFVKDTKIVYAVKRVYVDTVSPVDSVNVKYTANTTGTLDNISVQFEDKRAERTIVRTNTIETTITKNPGGLFVGVGSNLGLTELSPSIMYIKDKNAFGVKYNVAGTQTPLQNVGITYSRKLF